MEKLAQYWKPSVTSLLCGAFIGGIIYKSGEKGALLGAFIMILLTIGTMKFISHLGKNHIKKYLEYGIAGLLPGAVITLHIQPKAAEIVVSTGMILCMFVYAMGIGELIRILEIKDKYLSTTWEVLSYPLVSFGSILFSTWLADFIFPKNHILNYGFAILFFIIIPLAPGLLLAANRQRPILGNFMTFIGGLLVLWFGINLAPMLFLPGSGLYWAGIVIGLMMITLAILGIAFPKMGLLLGSLHIVVSILSFIGATGGLVAGGLLGVLGGVFVVSWNGNTSSEESKDDIFPAYTVESNPTKQQISV